MSNRLNEEEEDSEQILRCYEKGKWKECDIEYEELIEKKFQRKWKFKFRL